MTTRNAPPRTPEQMDRLHRIAKVLTLRQVATLHFYGNPCEQTLRDLNTFGGPQTHTIRALRVRGLIEPCDDWPFTQTTDDGGLVRAILARLET